ncbi:uncharacterized protein LOC130328055 [Hyla sarda]|uniref:uncharacterized protein LOC130328055 n=1 Tax=Hyla sarda TaxID=327740 RepID=UPI0024C3DDD1|nr:uncharacterized protein LOC130328055 [Hyla sarda]
MGSNTAPTYANIYMAHFEEMYVYVSHHFRHVLGWWRYIDDIFLIWSGGVSELLSFQDYLNDVITSIKFTLTHSYESINFLDVLVRVENGGLTTDLYIKPTDCNMLLKFESCHPRPMVNSLPFSQMLRARRITDTKDKLETALKRMTDNFAKRGYPRDLVQRHRTHVEQMEEVPERRIKNDTRVPFVTTYSEDSKAIGSIIRKHWHIIQDCCNISEFNSYPLLSYRRQTNLKDRLVKADISQKKGGTQRWIGGILEHSSDDLVLYLYNYQYKK